MRSIFLGSLCFLAACQSGPVATPPRQVSVIGYGKVTSYPDLADITVEVSFTKPRLRDAVTEVQAVIGQVNGVVTPFVKTRQDVRTSNVSTNKEYQYKNGKEVFAGFQATQSLTVRLTDLKRLEGFVEALLQTRVSRISQLSYSHTKMDSLRREAKTIALQDALKSADKLCATLGSGRGAVLEVKEAGADYAGSNYNSWRGSSVEMELYGKGMGGQGFKLTPELMTFNAEIQAAVELK